MGSVAGVSPLPLLALSVWPVSLPPLLPSPRIQKRGLVRCLLPPSGRSSIGGSHSKGDRFLQPGHLGSGEQSVPRADRSHSEY